MGGTPSNAKSAPLTFGHDELSEICKFMGTSGFVDTATFVTIAGMFSAHVTGNFVVLASDVAQGGEALDYLKFEAFPVLILAVIVGTLVYRWLCSSSQWVYKMLFTD